MGLLDPLLLGLQTRLVIGEGTLGASFITEQLPQTLQVGLQTMQLGARKPGMAERDDWRELAESLPVLA